MARLNNRINFIFSILVLSLLIGCNNQPDFSQKNSIDIVSTNIVTPTYVSNATLISDLNLQKEKLSTELSATKDSFSTTNLTPTFQIDRRSLCNWEQKKEIDKGIRLFYWESNGKELIFKKKGDSEKWFSYNIINRKIGEYIKISQPTKIPDEFGINKFNQYFISPEKKSLIFTLSAKEGYKVYFKRLNQKEPIIIGDIKGDIDKLTWLKSGNKIILSINWLGPLGAPEAYVYLLDIVERRVEILIPNSNNYGNITYVGLSPDENHLLYTSYSNEVNILKVFDISNKTSKLTELYTPLSFIWLPNKKEFIAVGYKQKSEGIYVYKYNIENNSVQYINDIGINAHPNISDSLQISPTFDSVAFIDEKELNLYLIDCFGIINDR